ncbi:hypothetical protein [Nostoc sp. CHAB 5836]|uniref:hypothetical protein n=1 Tax=Nostoc sp. CHAB 5836 TaxID=2780404 RepID=UPI00226FA6C2|nr:hypothetical protein [Nostoc sp. CHAB 5836]
MDIYGTNGNDNLTGTSGSDRIYGYGGNDTLKGGSGNDVLVGDIGDDILTGGPGRDAFLMYYSGGGIDRITDFSPQDDRVDMISRPNLPGIVNPSPLPLSDAIKPASDSSIKPVLNSAAGRNNTIMSGLIDDLIILGASKTSSSLNSGIMRYSPKSGALYYDSEQVAWLPTNLKWPTQPPIYVSPIASTKQKFSSSLMEPTPISGDAITASTPLEIINT